MTYISFDNMGDSPSGKTQIWEVRNTNDGSLLGDIRWHGAWRKYVLSIRTENVPAIWSADCLADVAKFIADKMEERKKHA